MKVLWIFTLAALARAQDLPRGEVIPDVKCAADASQSYALYLPSNYSPDRTWSLILAFDPGARGRLPVDRFQAAAEKYGYIVAGSNNSRNGAWQVSSAAADAMYKDVFSRFSIDLNRVYTAGFSGGARVAMSLAMGTGRVAGVIAASAAFPDASPRESVPFVVFGTAGTDDFNNREMREVDRHLTSPHRIVIFEGGHQWPPANLAGEAVEWLELQAMQSGLRQRDEAIVDRIFSARQARLGSAPDPLEEQREITSLVADFQGLRDVSAFSARAGKLQSEKSWKDAAKKERAEESQETYQRRELYRLVAGLTAEGADRRDSLMELTARVSALARDARAALDSRDRRLARRVLGELIVASGDTQDPELRKLLQQVRPAVFP